MEIKFMEEPCRYQRTLLDQISQREQTQELRLGDSYPDIGKVLGCWGQVCLRGKDQRSGSVGINGGVTAKVLYRPEEGGENQVLEAWIPFQQKWDYPDSGRDGFLWVCPRLHSLDARMVSARKLMLRATVSTWARALEKEQEQIPVPQIPEEDLQLLTVDYPMELIQEAGERLVQIDEEIELPDQDAKILRLSMEPVITEQKIIGSRLVFRGNGNLQILYMVGDEIKTFDLELPFSQYADLDMDVSPAANAEITPVVTELELDTEDGKLHLKAELAAQYLLTDRAILALAQDAYSCRREVTPQMKEITLPAILEKRQQMLTATCDFQGDVAKVADVKCLFDHPNRQGDGMMITGTFQLLYKDGDGMLQSASASFEVFQELPAEERARMDGRIIVSEQPKVSATGEGVKLSQSFLLETAVTGTQELPVVAGLELGERKEPDPNRPSIILRRCGDTPLWDIAKGCGSTVDAIREANHFETEPAHDQMLLIPVL